ncbi:MAG TPA: hypothetical protein DCG79_05605 [Clostridiales bacterium]|nr:hypothetical protein [Clostridiales bacterium]
MPRRAAINGVAKSRLSHILSCCFISFCMAFCEDVKRIFGEDFGAEVLLGFSGAVVSGHKGLSLISDEEVVVRLKKGGVRIAGECLCVKKASPTEIFVAGRVRAVEFLPPTVEVSA